MGGLVLEAVATAPKHTMCRDSALGLGGESEEDSVPGEGVCAEYWTHFLLIHDHSIQVTSYNSTLQEVYNFCIHTGISSPPYSQTHPAGY